MDIQIERLEHIEGRGRLASRLGMPPESCPYALGTVQYSTWQLGYLTDALEGVERAPAHAANEVLV